MARAEAKRPRGLAKRRRPFRPWRLLPALLLIAGAIAYFGFGLNQQLTLAALERNRTWLLAWTARHAILAPFAYTAIYATVSALSVPASAVLAFAGGALFPVPLATLYSSIAVTIGDTIVFVSAGAAVAEATPARLTPWLDRLPASFPRNPNAYLLFIRILPLMPAWLGNLGAVALGIELIDFILITFFGVIPAHIMYASLGDSFGAMLSAGHALAWSDIFKVELILPLAGLAILTLLYAAYRSRKGRS